jgi:hypothetical protein
MYDAYIFKSSIRSPPCSKDIEPDPSQQDNQLSRSPSFRLWLRTRIVAQKYDIEQTDLDQVRSEFKRKFPLFSDLLQST